MHVRFGEFTLDTDTRQVIGAEGEIHLSPKAYELLKLLLSANPEGCVLATEEGVKRTESGTAILNHLEDCRRPVTGAWRLERVDRTTGGSEA